MPNVSPVHHEDHHFGDAGGVIGNPLDGFPDDPESHHGLDAIGMTSHARGEGRGEAGIVLIDLAVALHEADRKSVV